MSRKMSPHQQSPRLRQLQQQLGGGPPLRSRNGGSPRQNGGGARVGDVVQAPQVRTIKTNFSRVILELKVLILLYNNLANVLVQWLRIPNDCS